MSQVDLKIALSSLLTYTFTSINEHVKIKQNTNKTPYSLFLKEKHIELKDNNKDISFKSKYISGLWDNMTNEEKQPYIEKSKNYKPEIKIRKERKKVGINSFHYFCKVKRQIQKKDYIKHKIDKKDYSFYSNVDLGEKWKLLSEKQKNKYKEAANKYNQNKYINNI